MSKCFLTDYSAAKITSAAKEKGRNTMQLQLIQMTNLGPATNCWLGHSFPHCPQFILSNMEKNLVNRYKQGICLTVKEMPYFYCLGDSLMANTVRFCSAVPKFNNESLPQCTACIASKRRSENCFEALPLHLVFPAFEQHLTICSESRPLERHRHKSS